MSAELLMVEQRRGSGDAAPWIREGGRTVPGQDDNRRLDELSSGLLRHPGVRAIAADAESGAVESALGALHEASYLEALRGLEGPEPVVLHDLATPGLEPDIPATPAIVAAAHEAVRTAIAAAGRTLAGARFSYAVCRPPGHHAGPSWLGGYCYLNSSAAAALTLREGGLAPVGILDLDLHYANGTSAAIEPLDDVSLHSLHASPVTNVPPRTVLPRMPRERVVEFTASPDAHVYLDAVAASLDSLARDAAALVLSLGYDTVAGDPHGSWDFSPPAFTAIGRLVAAAGLPVCIVQEGGYNLGVLADCAHAFATGLLGEAAPAGTQRAAPVAARGGIL